MKIAVTGGTGFVGQAVVARLREKDHEVVILSSSQSGIKDGVLLRQVDYHDVNALAEAMDGCDGAIHLVGILHEHGEQSFEWVHHALVRNVVKATAQAGIKDYIHMSALGVEHRGPSQYLKTKAAGEAAAFELAKTHDIRMVSLRPSIIFGEDDNFFNQFARLLRYLPVMPLVCHKAQFQPVAVEDVAHAFVWALESSVDRTSYELGGREVLTMREVIARVCETYDWKRLIIPLPDSVSRIQGKIMGMMPNAPFTYDNYLSMQVPNTTQQAPWSEMGIEPKPITIKRLF
ncbi:complex I NDUFA9 subunit family protein [Suttonella sp. R2A3]|uniref:complex I NDUFA9 subunit family protein n=1 Tax=Suttonella sp. R2A3 TaxID=2908648 RepID=UPI001F18F92B|nr:complex I NDUFA9 subunit family protein [Suttonella sp. R2A3]UJF24935.1 complex I NDUFA9 subunit family protein [Suttonella sp. R2A3]